MNANSQRPFFFSPQESQKFVLEKCLLPGVPRCNWKKTNIKETKNQVVKFQNLIIFYYLCRNLGKHRCSLFFPPKAMLHTERFLMTKKFLHVSMKEKKKITQRSWKSHLFRSPTTSYPSTSVFPSCEIFLRKPPRQSSQLSRQSTDTLQTIMVAL